MFAIEQAVLSPTFGLAEIKTEVFAIEQAVLGPNFGLAEIKTEVFAIEQAVLSPTFGLAEIKTEVFAIEQAINSGTFGLAEIKTEIVAIAEAVLSPTFGLAEIKTEIFAIESAIGGIPVKGSTQSSGPWHATDKYLSTKILNNTPNTVGPITVTAYDLSVCPKATFNVGGIPITATVSLAPFCATDIFFLQVGNTKLNIQFSELEVEFSGLTSGVLVYSRTTATNGQDALDVINNCCYM